MTMPDAAALLEEVTPPGEGLQGAPDPQRLRSLVTDHFAFVWRSLRHLGVGDGDADDAAQHVFLAASKKLASIPAGSERAFLYGAAVRIASRARRSRERRREVHQNDVPEAADPAPRADEVIGQSEARAVLETILDEMSPELREVFVLFEIEQLSRTEIADALEIPPGTVASRLRRARDEFKERARRYEARAAFRGGTR
jgi:RNA polymerase sigma-70 factor (ECF subfamily)